jgi:hypothetical protein
VNRDVRNNLLCDFVKMSVVSEVDHLPSLQHLPKKPEYFFRARMVEAFDDVVGNKRRANGCELLRASKPNSEIKLELRAR